MRANAAQFHAEIGKAGKGLGEFSGHVNTTEHTLARFASRLADQVAPGFGGMVHAAATARGAFAALQPIVIGVIGALGGFALGNAIQNFAKLREEGHGFVEAMKLAVGATKDFEERMKAAAEEEQKFNEQLKTAGSLRLGFAKQLASAGAEAAVSARTLQGDEIGAAEATLQGKLALIEIERKERERTIILSKLRAQDERVFLQQNDAIYLAARNAAYVKNAADVKKIQDDLTAKQVEKWKAETGDLIAELRARVSARQQFESELGQGAAGLGLDKSVAGGIKEVADLRKAVEKSGQEIAFLEREGLLSSRDAAEERLRLQEAFMGKVEALRDKFGGTSTNFFTDIFDEGNLRVVTGILEHGVPALGPVLDALNRLVSDVGFGNFGLQVERGRQFVDQFIASSTQLDAALDQLRDRLAVGVPAAVDQTSAEFQKLVRDLNEVAFSFARATGQALAFEQALAGARTSRGPGFNTGVAPVPEETP